MDLKNIYIGGVVSQLVLGLSFSCFVFGLQVFWLLWVCLPTWGSLCGAIKPAALMRRGAQCDHASWACRLLFSFVVYFVCIQFRPLIYSSLPCTLHYWLTLTLTTDCLNTLCFLLNKLLSFATCWSVLALIHVATFVNTVNVYNYNNKAYMWPWTTKLGV